MSLFLDAWASVSRNRVTVVVYLALTFAVGLTYTVSGAMLLPDPKAIPSWLPLYRILSILALCIASSVLSSVFLARLGREIDRPLWKCADDVEAVRRFFSTWFILTLLGSTMQSIGDHYLATGDEAMSAQCYLVFMILFVVTLPVGTCIMFGGGLDWPVVLKLLRPMTKMFSLTLNVLTLSFFEFLLYVGAGSFPDGIGDQVWFLPTVNVVLTALECYIFSYMWRVCMLHRDLPQDDSDDFDY